MGQLPNGGVLQLERNKGVKFERNGVEGTPSFSSCHKMDVFGKKGDLIFCIPEFGLFPARHAIASSLNICIRDILSNAKRVMFHCRLNLKFLL